MSSDFNPEKYEQPDLAKDEARSARTGLGLLLIAVFTIGQSIQVFSRVPGTSGPIFILAHLISVLLQVVYYTANVDAIGQSDSIGIVIPIAAQTIWLVYNIIALIQWRLRGIEAEINQLGVGTLYRWMNGRSAAEVGFASDMFFGTAITACCFLLSSPILGNWYLVATLGLLFAHLWMDFRQRREMQRFKNAKSRAEEWSYRINQHYRR